MKIEDMLLWVWSNLLNLPLESATHRVDDFGKLRIDYSKTAKCMILIRYITYA